MHIMSLQTLKAWEREEETLSLPVHRIYVGRPLQFIVQYHPQVFVGLHSLYLLFLNADWLVWCFRSPEIHHQLLFLVMFRRRQLFLVQSVKIPVLPPCPPHTHATTAVSSEYFCMWQDSELYLWVLPPPEEGGLKVAWNWEVGGWESQF